MVLMSTQDENITKNDPFRECLHLDSQVEVEAETTVNQSFWQLALQKFTTCPILHSFIAELIGSV